MRRIRIVAALAGLAALAAPGAHRAQSLGEVRGRTDADAYLSAEECEQSLAKTIELRWWVTVPGGALTNGIYRAFATNTAPTASGSGPKLCKTSDDTSGSNNVFAAEIGASLDLIASPTDTIRFETFDSWEIPAAAGLDCSEQTDRTIYVCIHFHPYTSGTTPATEPTGSATGTFVLSTGKPDTPQDVGVTVGDTRLHLSWSTGSDGIADTDEYEMVATPVAEVGLPDRPGERSATTTDTKGNVGDLVNGQDYQVVVYALSLAGTRSDGSAPQIGTPRAVRSFWGVYEDRAGGEQGGCGGPAGPIALLGVAAALALGGAPSRAGRRSKP
jgi:hypothetical protein